MKKIFLSLFIVAGLFFCTKSLAQSQIFVKVMGTAGPGTTPTGVFDGGSQVEGFVNQIEAIGYADGLAGCGTIHTGGGGGACKISHTPFQFSMPFSPAVIAFKNNMLIGRLLTSVDMWIRKNGGGGGGSSAISEGGVYYKVHMEQVEISAISEGGASPDAPTFNIELNPERIAWQVITQLPSGVAGPKASYGWDFVRNRVFTYSF